MGGQVTELSSRRASWKAWERPWPSMRSGS